MKATITSLIVSLAVAAIGACQDPVLQRRTTPELVLTGCLVQGASPTVLIFDNAKKDPKNADEKGERYVLASAAPDIDLRKHLNHAVRLTGEVDMRVSAMPVQEPSDPKRPPDERTLPRFIVRSMTMVAEKCPSPRP